jgi:hypothetical protein
VPRFTNGCAILAKWGNWRETNQPACTTNGATWSNGYLGVWHLAETTGAHRDSSPSRASSLYVSATPQGSAAGMVGGCDDFNGSSGYVSLPSMGTNAAVTVEAWARLNVVPALADNGLVSSDIWGVGYTHFKVSKDLQLKVALGGGGSTNSATNLLTVGSWFYGAYTIAGGGTTDLKLYHNATLLGSASGRTDNKLTDVRIAREYNGRYLNGRVDEVRISSVARSAAWLMATYQNIASNTVFNRYGSVVRVDNTPPVLAAISNRVVGAGISLTVTNSASDSDIPAQQLTFSLLAAPTNATINATNGLIGWRPLAAQAGTTNPFSVVVLDDGTPSLGATQNFIVTITPLAAPQLSGMALTNGAFRLVVSGDYGPDYVVQGSTNLTAWTNLLVTNSPVLPFNWSDPGASNLSRRFYRVLLGP